VSVKSGRSAVVVDDDAGIRELVALHLGELGFDVVHAPDGNEGLRLALDHEPDLLVVDVRMPGMSGYDLTREVRRLLPGYVRVLLMTGSVLASDLAEGFEAGADAYLKKPFAGQELRERIESLLALVPGDD
jgi:two-component system response regulator ResD